MVAWDQTTIRTAKIMPRRRDSRGIVITAENSGTKKQIVERRWPTPRTTIRKQQLLLSLMDIMLNFCYVSRMKLVVWWREQQPTKFPQFPQVVEAVVHLGMMPHGIGMVNKQAAKNV